MKLIAKKTGDRKFRLEKESQDDFFKQLEKLKIGETFLMDLKTGAKARSLQQSKYYWSKILIGCQYYMDELEHCCQPKDKESAHYNLKIMYCSLVRNDLIQTMKIRSPKTKKIEEIALPFSWKLSEMPAKESNLYINWCISLVESRSGMFLEKALATMT